MNKLFLTIFTLATASFAPMQAMMLSAVRQAARPALPQAQRPLLSVPQRPTMAPAVPTRPLLQPRSLQRPQTLQAHAFSTHSHNNAGNYQNSPYFKPAQPTEKSSSWFGYLLGAAAAAGIGYDLFGGDEVDKFKRSHHLNNFDEYELDEISHIKKLLRNAKFNESTIVDTLRQLAKQSPEKKEKIAQMLLQNPDTISALTNKFQGADFLIDILIDNNVMLAQSFATSITQNLTIFQDILDTVWGDDFLKRLMAEHEPIARLIANIFEQNPKFILKIMKTFYGSDVIELAERQNTNLEDIILDELCKNTQTIRNTLNTAKAIRHLYMAFHKNNDQRKTELAKKITDALTEDEIRFIVEDHINLLEKLIHHNPTSAQYIGNIIVQNPDILVSALMYQYNNLPLARIIQTFDPDLQIKLADTLVNNRKDLQTILHQESSYEFFKEIFKNKSIARYYTVALCQNPDLICKLATNWKTERFWLVLIGNDPNAAEKISHTIVQNANNISKLNESDCGYIFLQRLYINRPTIIDMLAKTITANVAILYQLCKSDHGLSFLHSLMKANSKLFQKVIEVVNSEPIIITKALETNNLKFLEKLITNPQSRENITITITQNPSIIVKIAANSHGIKFLEKLTDQNPQFTTNITTIITQNPDIVARIAVNNTGIKFLEKLMDQNPQFTINVTTIITQNPHIVARIAVNDHGIKFFEKLMVQNPRFTTQLTNTLIQNIDEFLYILPILSKINPGLRTMLLARTKEEACKTKDYENSSKMARIFQLCMEMPTQTGQHLQSNFEHTLNSRTVKQYLENEYLNTLHHRVVEKEQQLQQEGYFTFVHGQQRAYYLPEMLYTHLWQIFNNRQLKDFMFAHVKEPATDMQREERKLQKLRQDGRNSNNDRQRLLFLNYAFFGNDTNRGSNSALYLASNNNVGKITISAKDAYAHFDCSDVYETYKKELDSLDQEYRNLSSEGTLIMIGVPINKVNEMVYSAKSGGYKRRVRIEGIGETDDTQLILQTLREHPEKIDDTDRLEFCLIMTQKGGGLDPETGIKVVPFIPGDEQKLQELEQRRINLFARIKKSIEEKTGQA